MPLRVVHCPVNLAGTGWTTVRALRERGVDARLVVFRPQRWRPNEQDVNLQRPDKGLLRQQLIQWKALARLLPETDIFHFYFALTLVPKRLQFPILKAARKRSIMHFLGADIRTSTRAELRFWHRADVQIVGSYSAQRWVPEAEVVPPGLDVARFEFVPAVDRRPVRVVHAPSSREKKGTEHVVAACAQLPVELDIVHGVPNAEAIQRYRAADIVVDQLFRDWHGVFALEAMALGKPVVTSLAPDAVARTEEAFAVKIPIVAATKDDLVEKLRPLVESFELRKRIGEESRAYVERVHGLGPLTDRLLAIYERL